MFSFVPSSDHGHGWIACHRHHCTETWCELVDPSYYAAFSWCLLDSLADTAMQPPKLRPYREMKCITMVANEASMLKNYMMNKKIRSALAIQNDVLQRIPEVQKRLSQRKLGATCCLTTILSLLVICFTPCTCLICVSISSLASIRGGVRRPHHQHGGAA